MSFIINIYGSGKPNSIKGIIPKRKNKRNRKKTFVYNISEFLLDKLK